jgi:hypothetical protein
MDYFLKNYPVYRLLKVLDTLDWRLVRVYTKVGSGLHLERGV